MICILYKAVHCKQSSNVYYFYDCTKKSPILTSWGQHPYNWHHSSTHPPTKKNLMMSCVKFFIQKSIILHVSYILVVLDAFLKLSDEMVLMIFRWLPKNMLVRCALVCKRWQRIAYDEVLWTRMDLGSRTLNPGSLGHVLMRGSIILRLAQAEVRIFY